MNLRSRSALACAAWLAVGAAVSAQSCFEDATVLAAEFQPRATAIGDLNGDGTDDLATVCSLGTAPGKLLVVHGQPAGGFAPAVEHPTSGGPSSIALGDLDGDGDLDVTYSSWTVSDFGLVHRLNLGGGSLGPEVRTSFQFESVSFALGDIDQDGDLDRVLADRGGFVQVSLDQGSASYGAFAAWPAGAEPRNLVVADFTGDTRLDIVVTNYSPHGIMFLRNLGGSAFDAPVVIPSPLHSPWSVAAGDLDQDGNLDLVVGHLVSVPSSLSIFLNPGNAAFDDVLIPGLTRTSAALAILDVDRDGTMDVAATDLSMDRVSIVHDASGQTPFAVHHPCGFDPYDLDFLDVDGDLDAELVTTATMSGTVSIQRSCSISGTPLCAGDGSGAACPCANESTPGANEGCRSSLGFGGRLRASGRASLAQDELVLLGSQLPGGTGLYFQGANAVAVGAGAAFGDGLRCAGGAIHRLGLRTTIGGGSRYPIVGDEAVSIRGMVSTAGERVYQVWYRNAAAFCTASTFNLTNACRVAWAP